MSGALEGPEEIVVVFAGGGGFHVGVEAADAAFADGFDFAGGEDEGGGEELVSDETGVAFEEAVAAAEEGGNVAYAVADWQDCGRCQFSMPCR